MLVRMQRADTEAKWLEGNCLFLFHLLKQWKLKNKEVVSVFRGNEKEKSYCLHCNISPTLRAAESLWKIFLVQEHLPQKVHLANSFTFTMNAELLFLSLICLLESIILKRTFKHWIVTVNAICSFRIVDGLQDFVESISLSDNFRLSKQVQYWCKSINI